MLDVIWLSKNPQGVLTRIITIILLISKVRLASAITPKTTLTLSQVPTWLAFANGLRQTGGSFGSLNIGGRDLGGATGVLLAMISHMIY